MALPTHFTLKVANGKTIQIPSVGFGTWASETGWCKQATLQALRAGYRHLDCAWSYGVDQEVSEAIRESGVPRSEIFITTKFWPHFAAPENVELCLDIVLENMGLDYVDLFLAHWPAAFQPVSKNALKNAVPGPKASNTEKGILVDPKTNKIVIDWEHTSKNLSSQAGHEGSFVPTWQAMKKLVRSGKARAIGVSNFSITDIQDILPHAEDIPISCNQIEAHPWLPNNKLIDFMREHDILATCYSPFAGQQADGKTLIKDPTVIKNAERNGMDVGQCLQSWAVQRGTVPLGKSQTESRIKTNLNVKPLSSDDVKALNELEYPHDEGRTVHTSRPWGLNMFSN